MPRVRKCRRTIRDEEGGLLFRWRMPGGSLGRTTVAVVLTMILFGVGASLFQVSGKTVRTVNRETAHIIMLSPDTEVGRRWLDWAKQNSPFPDRWEVEVDVSLGDLMEFFDAELAQRANYQPLLFPLAETERQFDLPELFDPGAPRLPPVLGPVLETGPRPPVESRVLTSASGAIEDRWGELEWPLESLIASLGSERALPNPLELLGLQRRFLVMVDSSGEVVLCQILDEVESVLDGALAARIRQHKLEPGADRGGMAAGYVQVTVREITHPEKEKPEVKEDGKEAP